MVTNEEYEELYLLARKIVRFEKLLTNGSKLKQDFSEHLESIGYEFEDGSDYETTLRVIIFDDILNCYFLLGYPQSYNSNRFLLLDLIEYALYFGEIPWSYKEYQVQVESQYSLFFSKVFEVTKKDLKSVQFPSLYIELSNVDNLKAEEYINLLQNIAITLSKKQNKKTKDELIDILLSNPKLFLSGNDENNESQQLEDEKDEDDETIVENIDNLNNAHNNMELLKDKLINGISFEIIREEFHEGYSCPFWLFLRVTNFTDHKKKIHIRMNYISSKHGLKKQWEQEYIPDNSFVDLDFRYEDITKAYDGDRIEMEINEGKFATLRLLRERGQWTVIESIERSTYNKELKSRIEHFEAIEEQFGITLQNFSVKVEDENALNLFCEVLALNGEVPQKGFNVEVAIYDSENSIIYQTSLSRYDGDFKGFEVFNFGTIRLDISVDEISKIRIYPTR